MEELQRGLSKLRDTAQENDREIRRIQTAMGDCSKMAKTKMGALQAQLEKDDAEASDLAKRAKLEEREKTKAADAARAAKLGREEAALKKKAEEEAAYEAKIAARRAQNAAK
jgi:hypothetical protein